VTSPALRPTLGGGGPQASPPGQAFGDCAHTDAALHNAAVNTALRPIPVFAAATRAVREARLPAARRARAFEALEALAGALGHASAAGCLDQLMALAATCHALDAALAPHVAPLRAVVAACSSLER
jgi:hypothetical protein